jgi:hypothetical protein
MLIKTKVVAAVAEATVDAAEAAGVVGGIS